MRQRRWVAGMLTVGLACSSVAPVARAAPEESTGQRVERLAAEAAAAYRGAEYARAVELLERAYQIRQIAALLYNTAKAYEKLGQEDRAVDLYHRYSDSTDADPKLRVKAEARIAAYEEAHRPKPPENHAVVPDVPPTLGVGHVDPPHHRVDGAETSEERAVRKWQAARHRDRIVGITLTSLGAACALTAVGTGAEALVLHQDYTRNLGDEFAKRSERDRAQSEAIASDVFYAVAAAAVGVGAYFLWRGYHPARPPGANLMLAPTMNQFAGVPTGGGLVLGGRF